jgi:lysophospholipase L1-like esterase
MRIIILSDSLGRPRPDIDPKERTFYKDVYGSLLREKFQKTHDIELCYIESLDSSDALFWNERMVAFRQPDIVVYHLGINDCVPRVFKKNKKYLIHRAWFKWITRDIIMRVIHKYRYQITRIRKLTYTDKMTFEINIKAMQEKVRHYSPKAEFIGISIARAPQSLSRRSYGINKNIEAFNRILQSIFGNDHYIEINDLLPADQLLIGDNIHLTQRAHSKLADHLAGKINGITKMECR